MKAAIGLVDLVGLYCALTRVTYRNISFSHKFQAVGLGMQYSTCIQYCTCIQYSTVHVYILMDCGCTV